VRITVRVTPRAGADRVDGVGEQGELRVRVRSPAAIGQANEACLRTLAEALDVGRSRVNIVRGHTTRTKLLEVEGVAVSAVESRWPGVKVGTG
jgi:uncharacterized protein (TIGR00251 family)